MDPDTFDATAGLGLLMLLPASVMFVAAALRRLDVPRWVWVPYLAAVAGVLVLLHLAGSVRYPVESDWSPHFGWDFWQFVGLGLGRIGVGVNAVVAAAWIASRRRGSLERLPRRETALVVGSYGTMAIATAVPAAWWGIGLGVVPLVVELPIVAVGAGLLACALVLRWRRRRRSDVVSESTAPWPTDAVVAVWLVGALAVGPLIASGSGLPDASLARRTERPTTTAEPSESPDLDRPVTIVAATTSLGSAAIEAGTRAALEDTVRWAGPLDDLDSPTPTAGASPPIVVKAETCATGGTRWTGSLVLPSVRPQDAAEGVRDGWERSGYVAFDRAMGTDVFGPRGPDAAVSVMRLGGGADGVHVVVESFCS